MMPGLAARARLLLITFWAGSLWTVGYVAAPTLFASFDRPLAGSVAAVLFASQAWVSIACGGALLALLTQVADARARRRLQLLVVAMLVCAVAMHFWLQPLMASLRGAMMDEAARARFGMLHGVSALIYLVESLLAGFLLLKNPA